MPKLRRKVITIEVETEATNADVKACFNRGKGNVVGDGFGVFSCEIKQVSVNDVTPKGGKGKR